MTKRKETAHCKHCGTPFPPNKKQSCCSLKCSFESRAPTGDPQDCWIWEGAKNDAGYGQIRFAGETTYTHRLAYELKRGPLGGLRACHRCDTPACCNPDHIIPGTQAFNLADMRKKGRGSRPPIRFGRKASAARFTSEQIIEARRLLAGGMTQKAVGTALGMSQGHASRIARGLVSSD